LEVIFCGAFSGKFGKIWAKPFRTPKNLPAPTPMSHGIAQLKAATDGEALPLGAEDQPSYPDELCGNKCLQRCHAIVGWLVSRNESTTRPITT